MDLIHLNKQSTDICKSVWTVPLPHEEGAPENRIIHIRQIQFDHPAILERIGIRLGLGYLKCGSQVDSDCISSFRFFGWQEGEWKLLAEENHVDPPQEKGQVIWFPIENKQCFSSVMLEVRKSMVDGWWPCWNIVSDGIELEGELTQADKLVCERRTHTLSVHEGSLPDGVESFRQKVSQVFRTRYYQIGFRLYSAGCSFLGMDSTGRGRVDNNLLSTQSVFIKRDADEIVQGFCFRPNGEASVAGSLNYRLDGETEVQGNKITYKLYLPQYGQKYEIIWIMEETRIILRAVRIGERSVVAGKNSLWQFSFNSQATPITLLGELNKQGQTGFVCPPAVLHAPNFGCAVFSGGEQMQLRFDSIRPQLINTVELKLGEIADASGDSLLPVGRFESELVMDFAKNPISSTLVLNDDIPKPVREAVERCLVTALPFRADSASYSNNGNSIHAPICLDWQGIISLQLKDAFVNLRPIDYLKTTLERWFDGAPAYASGKHSDGHHDWEDEYLLTGTAGLLGLAVLLCGEKDSSWLERYREPIKREIEKMKARDLDGDGLIESQYRLGNSNEHQWSTSWYDAVSCGWKDAFSNGILFAALKLLSSELTRLGDADLAQGMEEWASLLEKSFVHEFYNPQTGWFGAWRSKDGQLHDYGFLAVNGIAAAYGIGGRSSDRR